MSTIFTTIYWKRWLWE